jgi:hypothetical protein
MSFPVTDELIGQPVHTPHEPDTRHHAILADDPNLLNQRSIELDETIGTPPPLDPTCEDVVEVSFRPVSAHSRLVQWAGEAFWELDLKEIDYRVRYCAQGMDQARQKDTRLDGEPLLDRYLLQFWPAPPEPDRVVRQTSEIAASWHDYARRRSLYRRVVSGLRGLVRARPCQQPPPPTPE